MPDWSDENKTPKQINRRKEIVKRMENTEFGWVFVCYVEYSEWGKCQVTGARIKTGVKVMNPTTNSTFVVAPDVAITYVNSVVIPRKRPENTQIEEKLPFIELEKEKKDPKTYKKRGPKPKNRGENE